MKTMPCIRGLNDFKKGCPKRCWNNETGEGCPAWIELMLIDPNNPLNGKKNTGNCIDLWKIDLKLRELGLIESNVIATESFRNGMVFKDKSGNIVPKSSGAELALLQMINKNMDQQQLDNIEPKKLD